MEKENKTLYNIQISHLHLMEEIEEAEGVLTPEMEEALTINEKDLEKKSVGYLEVIKAKERFNSDIKAEIDRLRKIQKQNDALVKILKDRLLNAVKVFGVFKVGTLTFGSRKSTSLIIENEALIPKEYKINKVVTSIDSAKLKQDLKTMDIASAHLQTNQNLSIK